MVLREGQRILYREVATALPCFPAHVEIVRVGSHPVLKPLDPVLAWIQTPHKDTVRSVGFSFASGIGFDVSASEPLVNYLQ